MHRYLGLVIGVVSLALAVIGGSLIPELACAAGVGFSVGVLAERARKVKS